MFLTCSGDTHVGASFEESRAVSFQGRKTHFFSLSATLAVQSQWFEIFLFFFLNHFLCQSGCKSLLTWTTVHQHIVEVDFLPYNSASSSSTHLVFFLLLFLLLLLRGVRVPGEALLIERDDHLGTFDIGLLGWDEVRFIWILPVFLIWKKRQRRERNMSESECRDRNFHQKAMTWWLWWIFISSPSFHSKWTGILQPA